MVRPEVDHPLGQLTLVPGRPDHRGVAEFLGGSSAVLAVVQPVPRGDGRIEAVRAGEYAGGVRRAESRAAVRGTQRDRGRRPGRLRARSPRTESGRATALDASHRAPRSRSVPVGAAAGCGGVGRRRGWSRSGRGRCRSWTGAVGGSGPRVSRRRRGDHRRGTTAGGTAAGGAAGRNGGRRLPGGRELPGRQRVRASVAGGDRRLTGGADRSHRAGLLRRVDLGDAVVEGLGRTARLLHCDARARLGPRGALIGRELRLRLARPGVVPAWRLPRRFLAAGTARDDHAPPRARHRSR